MRIRSTKPEFWRSKTIAAIPWDARLVLKGLESYVDDNGVGKDDIALIAADVFPRDLSANPRETLERLSEAISTLAEAGLIARYDADGEDLLYIDKWKDIQRIDKPTKGRYPRPDGTFDYHEDVNRESYRNPRGPLANPPEVLAPVTGEQGNRGTGEQSLAPAPPPRGRDEIWDTMLEACGVSEQITKSARGAYNAARRDLAQVGATPAEIRLRASRFRRRWPNASLTPTALVRRWAELDVAAVPEPAARRPFWEN